MTADAFKATYSDWKVVKTRGVVQVVFEVPLSDEGAAYKVLGGMPDPARERWFGVARLNPEGARQEGNEEVSEEPRSRPHGGGEHKKWDELSPAQQAGILGADKSFHAFLRDRYTARIRDAAEATDFIHRFCAVGSRRDIAPNPGALNQWRRLVSNYRDWQREPEVVG